MIKKFVKVNIGCGETKLEGYINIDVEKKVNPDIVLDIRKSNLPFKADKISEICCIHNLEHIEIKKWPRIFDEFWRVLKPNGRLILAYPEFEKCAKYFLDNYRGMREFWRATLYGRQLWKGDYHVVPMETREVIEYLQMAGFDNIKYRPEEDDDYNTFLLAHKSTKPITKEQISRRAIFGLKN